MPLRAGVRFAGRLVRSVCFPAPGVDVALLDAADGVVAVDSVHLLPDQDLERAEVPVVEVVRRTIALEVERERGVFVVTEEVVALGCTRTRLPQSPLSFTGAARPRSGSTLRTAAR